MQGEGTNIKHSLQTFITSKTVVDEIPNICKQPFREVPSHNFLKEKMNFECHKISQESNCMDGYELKNYFLYAFAHTQVDTSIISVYSFSKESGSQSKVTFKGLNGIITCLKFMLIHDEVNTSDEGVFKLLAGTYDGFLKILDLKDSSSFTLVKLDVKPIKGILAGHYQRFHTTNICIIMANDSQISFVDLDKRELFYILKPNIVMGDQALSISSHYEQNHLLTTTKGGYLIVWKLDNVIELSKERKINKQTKTLKGYSAFPITYNHSIAIDGLIWCSFYGNLLILITEKGWLKIVGIMFSNQSQYIELTTFKVEEPQSISSVRFFASDDLLVLSKNTQGTHFLELIRLNNLLEVKNVRKIIVEQIDFLQEIFLTKKFNILMCRGNSCFVINQCPDHFYQSEEDKKYLDY